MFSSDQYTQSREQNSVPTEKKRELSTETIQLHFNLVNNNNKLDNSKNLMTAKLIHKHRQNGMGDQYPISRYQTQGNTIYYRYK